ncbi:hypothetical protein [uncultured Roseivirga sp.]|uniref:hypothetical protein n=1 Tax=uncultured Roseivirga sp. TaxID=543088 RepID=UPI0030D8C565
MIIGFLLIILAKFFEETTKIEHLGNIASSIGGVFMGIGVSSIIQLVRMRNYQDYVFEKIQAEVKTTSNAMVETKDMMKGLEGRARLVLSKYAKSGFKSTDTQIRQFKKKYHGYYQSQDKKSGILWQYHILDFSTSITPGVLECPVTIIQPSSKKQMIYHQEAYRLDNNSPLVMNTRDSVPSSELTSVTIFPFVKNHSNKYYGIQLHEGWNDKYLISAYIISEEPLYKIQEPGIITDRSKSDQLLKDWKEFMDDSNVSDLTGLNNKDL